MKRLSTGVPGLDQLLGGGLLPGTLSVIVGPTGVGKTQLGLQFAAAGASKEARRGIVFDMACRGDAQGHAAYAERMFQWQLDLVAAKGPPALDDFFSPQRVVGNYLHIFDIAGRRVTRGDLGFEAWQEWQAELTRKLGGTIAFLYGNFVRGVRRVVIDGIEPVDRPSDSVQFELVEYIYHQILRKDPEWVARDLFRERYRAEQAEIAKHTYDPATVACMLMCTSAETMLEPLIERPLDEGGVLANANTVIYLGRRRSGDRLERALYVAKHRGSACSDEIIPYTITDSGLSVVSG